MLQEIKIRQYNCGNELPDNLKMLLQIANLVNKNVQMRLQIFRKIVDKI